MARTLLLADDSITIQRVVGITFANEDFEITTVDNGEDAIQKAKELKPNIILADVIMPKKNGYEVCQTIKSDPALRSTPVLLLAGTFEAFDENRARAVGANGHITKPFESQALIDKVNMLLGAGAVQAPLGVAQPAPVSGQPRVIPQPQPLSAWDGSPATPGRAAPTPMQPSAFGQPPRPMAPAPTPQSPRPFSTGPQPIGVYSPGAPITPPRPLGPSVVPQAPRPLSPQPMQPMSRSAATFTPFTPQAPHPITQPMQPAPRPLATPAAPPSFVSPTSRPTAQPIPTAIPPSTAIPATPPPAGYAEHLSEDSVSATKPKGSSLFEEASATNKAFESQPLEPSSFESDASVDLEPEPLEPEPFEPEPAESTTQSTQPLDALESLDVEGADTWAGKEDITKPIPTLRAAVESERETVGKKPTDEITAKPETISADLSFLQAALSSKEGKAAAVKPESDILGLNLDSAYNKLPYEARPEAVSEPLPEVLPEESIELPSVDIEEDVLTDPASEYAPGLDSSAKLEEKIAAELTATAVPKSPVAPIELATAAAIAATKRVVGAPAEVEEPIAPQLSKSELEAIAREIIEKVVWEVVPQLAEAILREEIEKLVQEKLAE